MNRLVFLILVLVPLPAPAAQPVSIESIAAGYFSTESYCDAGKRGWRDDPSKPFTQEHTFERCASRDGRFKYVERYGRSGAEVKWTDGKKHYRYLEHGRRYQEMSSDDASLFDLYRDRSQVYPVFIFHLLVSDPRRLVDPAERSRYLKSFTPNSALSTSQHTVFERFEANANYGERLWVLNANKSIARHEALGVGGVLRYVEITSQGVNRPLSDEDLSYDAPLFARFSMMNNPAVFISALHVAAGLAGALVWGWLFARSAAIEDVLRKRRRLWRIVLWSLAVTVAVLAALAVLTIGGGGHPPPIIIVIALGAWCAVAFGMAACFLLASYPLQLLFKRVRTSQ